MTMTNDRSGPASGVEMLEVHPGMFISGHKALWLPAEGLAAVADLHLGYTASLGRRGAYLPGRREASARDALLALVGELALQRLLLLGDLKHSTRGADAGEVAALQEVLGALAGRVELTLVRGNHDRGLERLVELAVVDQVEAGGWTFAHGDRLVAGERVVVGHEHPAFHARDALGAGFRAPCFLVGEHSIVLPAFSPDAAGTDVGKPPPGGFLSPYTRREPQRCYVVEGGRLFLVALLA
jgi:uncharacterized protein